MQPDPTYGEILRATPAEIAELINPNVIHSSHGVVMSDCTERWVQSPALCAFFHFLFSAYKNRTTVKHLTVTSGNGFLHTVGTFAPIDDADCIKMHGVADRLGRALKYYQETCGLVIIAILSFIYDKGLDSFPAFLRNMIRVVMPDKKQNHQQVFKKDSSQKDTTVAKVRNIIENLNAELKQYVGFSRTLPLASLDMAAHEVNVARFLVNLKPEYRAKDIQSAFEETIVEEKNAVHEMAHESGSECCSCAACTAFRRTRNKVLFQGADEMYAS